VEVQMQVESTDLAQAVVTYITTINGKATTQERRIKGTAQEVKAQLKAIGDTASKPGDEGEKVVIDKIEIRK
ncbi:MAG: hypothetical protein HKM92_10645, partial [Arenibacter sp.]|nr:hypothetical protein [Arenibacter sp.]